MKIHKVSALTCRTVCISFLEWLLQSITDGFTTTGIYSLMFLEVRSPKSRHYLSRPCALRGLYEHLLASLSAQQSQVLCGSRSLTLISASIFTGLSSLMVSVFTGAFSVCWCLLANFPFLTRTLVIQDSDQL